MEKKRAIDWVRNVVIGCIALLGVLALTFPLLSVGTGANAYSENGFFFLSFKGSKFVSFLDGDTKGINFMTVSVIQLCMGIVATGLAIYAFFTKKRATKKCDVTVIVLTAIICVSYLSESILLKQDFLDFGYRNFYLLHKSGRLETATSAYIPLVLWLIMLVGYIVVKAVEKSNK